MHTHTNALLASHVMWYRSSVCVILVLENAYVREEGGGRTDNIHHTAAPDGSDRADRRRDDDDGKGSSSGAKSTAAANPKTFAPKASRNARAHGRVCVCVVPDMSNIL